MHILFIPSWYPKTPSDISGSFFREQAQALRKQGCRVGVITLQLRSLRDWHSLLTGRYDITLDNDFGVVTYRKHAILLLPRIHAFLVWMWKKHCIALFEKYINKYGMPDIIHVHSMLYAGVAAKAISEKHQIPFIVTEHSTAFAREMITAKQKRIIQEISVSAEKRFAVSQPFSQLLFEFIGIKNSSWEVVPNIVHERFLNFPANSSAKSLPFTFINIALLTPKKGVDFLIKSFAKALTIQPDLKLKIGGDGYERLKLEALAHELGITESIEFLGMLSREQVLEQMTISDAFILSSQYETFGVVVIEALALGLPVIATRCGGPEDIVREQDGVLVPVSDIDAMVNAMLNLFKNREMYNNTEIRAACYERYSEQAITEKLMHVYRDVLGKNCK